MIMDKIGSGGKFVQNSQDLLERLQNFLFFPEFLEILCLFTEKAGDGLDGSEILDSAGERVFGQFYARLSLVVFQSGLEERMQT